MSEKSSVYATCIEDYVPHKLEQKIREGFAALGGIEALVRGKKVFIKINQLSNRPPEKAVTTHPLVVEKVVEILLEYGARISIGDDIQGKEKEGYEITGMSDISRKLNLELVNLKTCGYEKLIKKENRLIKELYVARPVLDADILINIPKLKTHSQTLLTSCIKNLYGIIPMGERTWLHKTFSRIQEFSEILVDVYSTKIPSLNILDGIFAMEGEGPASGPPRNTGLLLIGRDAVALDSVICRILGIEPEDVGYIAAASSRGLGKSCVKDIQIFGTDINQLKIDNFIFPLVKSRAYIPQLVDRFAYKLILIRPKVIPELCKLCGKCVQRCPVNAIKMQQGSVKIDYKICLGCLCCHEVCDMGAIKTVRRRGVDILINSFHAVQRLFGRKK